MSCTNGQGWVNVLANAYLLGIEKRHIPCSILSKTLNKALEAREKLTVKCPVAGNFLCASAQECPGGCPVQELNKTSGKLLNVFRMFV